MNVVDGAAVAYHGCKVACGASLISSQIRTLTNPSSGAAQGAGEGQADVAMQRFGEVGNGMAAAYEDSPLDDGSQRFLGRFQLVSAENGMPIAGQAIRVRCTDGQYLTGTTDAEGYTSWVEREGAGALAFDFAEKTE